MKTITGSKCTHWKETCLTVSELMELLSKVPPETPVMFQWEGQNTSGYTDPNYPEIDTTTYSEPVLILNADG